MEDDDKKLEPLVVSLCLWFSTLLNSLKDWFHGLYSLYFGTWLAQPPQTRVHTKCLPNSSHAESRVISTSVLSKSIFSIIIDAVIDFAGRLVSILTFHHNLRKLLSSCHWKSVPSKYMRCIYISMETGESLEFNFNTFHQSWIQSQDLFQIGQNFEGSSAMVMFVKWSLGKRMSAILL